MAISASLAGRLRNTSLPKAHALLPLYEAVVNAIQSVDMAHDSMESTRISVEIIRSQQSLFSPAGEEVDPGAGDPITGFVIRDNGEGFHDENMRSFETLDSQYKSVHGCRNLWVMDEGLAFHDHLASDKPLSGMPITGSSERIEPDLLALRINDNPILVSEGGKLLLASIVVVEFKRLMRNDSAPGRDKDPLAQALQYLERIRGGGVTAVTGRPIPKSDQIPDFCYVISDLTRTVRECCKAANLRLTRDGLRFFGYNDNYKAYIEVISFDRLLNMAHQRNRAFFDQLGLPVI
ncbi:hypothetical protein [Nonomuraea dietziae]|uniref:hypothetical protein n=1 Tax=Nonomuraea dietziae TaxID=65515 RepID=UPI0034376284